MATEPQDIRDITGSTLADTVIQPFIGAAGCIMAQISDCTSSMTDVCVDQVTAYLSAHLLTSTSIGKDSLMITKESLRGKYSVEYLAPKAQGSGVLSTTHGQTANMMTGGCLAQLDKAPVSFHSIGCI